MTTIYDPFRLEEVESTDGKRSSAPVALKDTALVSALSASVAMLTREQEEQLERCRRLQDDILIALSDYNHSSRYYGDAIDCLRRIRELVEEHREA